MDIKLLFLILINFFLLCSEAKLEQLFSLARHGARYHTWAFYDGLDTKPLWGELTAVGQRQNQKFGQLIRKDYVFGFKFLSEKFNNSEIEVYTTRKNRTYQTAASLFYGVYPPTTGPSIPSVAAELRLPPYTNKTDISESVFALPKGHQPIRVKNDERVILSDCPKYDDYADQNFGRMADTIKEMNATYFPFMKRMSQIFKFQLENATFEEFVNCYDAANVDLYLGRPWPAGFTEDDFNNVKHFTNWYYYVAMSNNNSLMVNTFKFQKLMDTFDMRIKQGDAYPLKWVHLSGHDTDVLAIHMGLNISSAECTEELYRKGQTKATECEQGGVLFASNVLIELHSTDAKTYVVKVRSNGKYMKICSKGAYECDYNEFKALLRLSMTDANMNDFCGFKIKDYFPKPSKVQKMNSEQ